MSAWFASAWAKIVAVGVVLLGILIAIGRVFSQGKQAGEARARADQEEAARQARQRIDDVMTRPPTPSETSDKLRKGQF